MNPRSEQTLYRFWHKKKLLYVGISVDAFSRAYQHSRDSKWWREADRMTMERYPDRSSVLVAEKRAIQTEHPKYNVQHAVHVARRRAATVQGDTRAARREKLGAEILYFCERINAGGVNVFQGPIVNWGDPERWWDVPNPPQAERAWVLFGHFTVQELYEAVESGRCSIWDAGVVLQIRAQVLGVKILDDDPRVG